MGGAKAFCCDLCSEIPSVIRYIRRTQEDGRIEDGDIQEAIDIKVAQILGGGYPKTARRLTVQIRQQVIEAAKGRCAICGSLANEVDHIMGSSAELSNLQLLCHECHLDKTHVAMGPAPELLVEGAYKPIIRRAHNLEPNQPCDTTSWDHRRWATTEPRYATVGEAWRREFSEELGGAVTPPSLFDAAEGFPRHLDPWTWY